MTHSDEPLFPTTWKTLPDPRDSRALADRGGCTLSTDEFVWSKVITEKHMVDARQKRAWEDWLTPKLVSQLSKIWDPTVDVATRTALLEQVSILVAESVRMCLQRPLVVVYDEYESAGKRKRPAEKWELVLPSGALLVTRMTGATGKVMTFFFKDLVCGIVPARERWRELVRWLVELRGEPRGGKYIPPVPSWEVAGQEGEIDTFVRFVTLDEWGFCGEEPPNHWSPRNVESWPSEKTSVSAPERKMTRPRFSREEDADELSPD
jgi:hypothetical protein